MKIQIHKSIANLVSDWIESENIFANQRLTDEQVALLRLCLNSDAFYILVRPNVSIDGEVTLFLSANYKQMLENITDKSSNDEVECLGLLDIPGNHF